MHPVCVSRGQSGADGCGVVESLQEQIGEQPLSRNCVVAHDWRIQYVSRHGRGLRRDRNSL